MFLICVICCVCVVCCWFVCLLFFWGIGCCYCFVSLLYSLMCVLCFVCFGCCYVDVFVDAIVLLSCLFELLLCFVCVVVLLLFCCFV